MELKDYTTEELREELKRRKMIAMREASRTVECKEFTAVVKSVDKSRRPFRYRIEQSNLDNCYSGYLYHDFTYRGGIFDKTTSPRIGDKVRLVYKRTKVNRKHELFDILKAKIVEVVERRTCNI